MKVAYARVMLVGPGGVGKSSLLHGLMNLPLPTEACSTQLADTFTLRPTDTYWARSKCGGHWIKVTDKDEIDELVQLVRARNKLAKKLRSPKLEKKALESPELKLKIGKFTHPQVKEIVDEAIEAASAPADSPVSESLANASAEAIDTYLRIWDCGGQPVFLDILPAFLTARTLFLLMFDARYNLQSPCLHRSHLHGVATEQVADMTTLQLMVQWMALIHATLLRKKSIQNATDEIDRFPQILPVGTHGDDEAVKEKGDSIFDSLYSICDDKAFAHLLLKAIVVDNMTAGSGIFEDLVFQKIREIANKFATEDLAIRTPIKWVLFRKVFERYARNRPVVPLEVVELGKECSISGQALLSVLAFYHDLAVVFHYSPIPSLKSVIIANPQWLIQQIAKILALEGHEQVQKENLWRLLRGDGILVEPLYNEVLRTQQELEPQAIIDLLEHFLIIAEIHTKDRHKSPGREYFVPSVLPSCLTEGTPHLKTGDSHQSDPLHLIFNTNYLPPGFFVRLATAISKDSKCQVDFQTKIYRNAISFFYGRRGEQVDRLTVKERKFSIHIQVQRLTTRSNKGATFIHSCHEIMKMLQKAILKVQEWLPGIDVGFALECHKCTDSDHFIPLPEHSCSDENPTLLCQKKIPSQLAAEQMFWYTAHQVSAKYNIVYIIYAQCHYTHIRIVTMPQVVKLLVMK